MMQRNSKIKALEDSIAEFNSQLNNEEYINKYPHPSRKLNELRTRVKELEYILNITKLIYNDK